jgi:hypothetical protein
MSTPPPTTPRGRHSFRHSVSIPAVALEGENATSTSQTALYRRVQKALAQFADRTSVPESTFSIRDDRVHAFNTEFVLDSSALAYEKELHDFLKREVNNAAWLAPTNTAVPGRYVPSRREQINGLSVFIPTRLPRPGCASMCARSTGAVLALSVALYFFYIIFYA